MRRPPEQGVLQAAGNLLVPAILFPAASPIDADALAHVDQVWRGEQAGAVACLAQHPLNHGTGGALALSPRHVDDAQLWELLVQAQPLQ